MPSSPREIGTLIVVVLKANHLPNKRHIGKQDPYCLVVVNGDKRRTKAIKRGGQHPEWDEELRFTLFEDDDDLLAKTSPGTPPPPPPKDSKGPKKVQGGNFMKVACYADDPREPDLIGDTDVDLTEVLTKGETDEWFTLSNKDKFAGKIYLELTFWSNEPPPEKKVTPKPPKTNKQYGGPGSFVPSNGSPSRMELSGVYSHSRPPSDNVSVPSSLRASNTLAKLDLYVPPYERASTNIVDQVTSEFGDMGISQRGRRESYPPVHYGYTPPPNPYIGEAIYIHGHSPTPSAYPIHSQYQLDGHQHSLPPRTPRHSSIPVSSSGFMPLPNSSTFSPPIHTNDAPTYPLSQTPIPGPYNPTTIHQSQVNYHPPQTPLPLLPSTPSYIPAATPVPYAAPSYPSPQSHQYIYPPSTPAPLQQYPSPIAQVQQVQNGVTYPPYQPISPPHENLPPATSTPNALSGSRPLPLEPQVVYTPQDGLPPPPPPPPPALVPPPPPPPVHYNQVPPPPPITQSQTYTNGTSVLLPPPPPPPPLPSQAPPHQRPSLPVPPVAYPPPQLTYQPPPPPPIPVPRTDGYPPSLVPSPGPTHQPYTDPQVFNPGPPPEIPSQFLDNNQWQTNGVEQVYTPAGHRVPNYA